MVETAPAAVIVHAVPVACVHASAEAVGAYLWRGVACLGIVIRAVAVKREGSLHRHQAWGRLLAGRRYLRLGRFSAITPAGPNWVERPTGEPFGSLLTHRLRNIQIVTMAVAVATKPARPARCRSSRA
jgi:hypothetical protein